jgi:hypothetical protein
MTKCKYCNECIKRMTMMNPICGYGNECKTNDYYGTYMWVLHI